MSELTLDPVFPLPPGDLGAGDITFLSADWFICQLGAMGGVGPTLGTLIPRAPSKVRC